MSERGSQWEALPRGRYVPFGVVGIVAVVGLLVGFGAGQVLGRSGPSTHQPVERATSILIEPLPSSPSPSEGSSRGLSSVTVPLVEGLTVRDASRVLKSLGLRPVLDTFETETHDRPFVVVQHPPAGSVVARSSNVGLYTDDKDR